MIPAAESDDQVEEAEPTKVSRSGPTAEPIRYPTWLPLGRRCVDALPTLVCEREADVFGGSRPFERVREAIRPESQRTQTQPCRLSRLVRQRHVAVPVPLACIWCPRSVRAVLQMIASCCHFNLPEVFLLPLPPFAGPTRRVGPLRLCFGVLFCSPAVIFDEWNECDANQRYSYKLLRRSCLCHGGVRPQMRILGLYQLVQPLLDRLLLFDRVPALLDFLLVPVLDGPYEVFEVL